VPDPQRWNISLEAVGEVAPDTASSKGPATFYQRGWSMFRARKRLTVDRRGIRMFSAEAESERQHGPERFFIKPNSTHPALGRTGSGRSLRNQYDSSQPAAKVEWKGRFVGRATSQLDTQVAAPLEKAKQDFQVKMIKPPAGPETWRRRRWRWRRPRTA